MSVGWEYAMLSSIGSGLDKVVNVSFGIGGRGEV